MKVGIDIGTTTTKAVVFGSTGHVVTRRSIPTSLSHPGPGRYEQDVEQLVDAVFGLLRDLPLRELELIALTGQGDGLWLIDEHARSVGPALSWLDARGAPVCDSWREGGQLDELFARTRNAPFPGAGGALLAALERSEPAALASARTATQCQHVLFERMTGVRTATRSCAMLPVFDPVAGDYDEEALRLTGLATRRDLLPEVASTSSVIAPLIDDVADDLKLARGALVATGPYDLPAAALGVGSLAAGDGLMILGTTLACQVLVDRLGPIGAPTGLTLCTANDSGWLRAMPAMVGTACLDWVLDLVGLAHADLGRLLSSSVPGAHGVAALPFFSPAGERAPFADSAARAELTGLSLESTAADIVTAVCEGLGYTARHCFEAAGLAGDIVVCGGGTATPELVQLLADILDRPLTVLADDDPAARGAVNAASLAMGIEASPASVRATVHAPQGQRSRGYADYLDRLEVARRTTWRTDKSKA